MEFSLKVFSSFKTVCKATKNERNETEIVVGRTEYTCALDFAGSKLKSTKEVMDNYIINSLEYICKYIGMSAEDIKDIGIGHVKIVKYKKHYKRRRIKFILTMSRANIFNSYLLDRLTDNKGYICFYMEDL